MIFDIVITFKRSCHFVKSNMKKIYILLFFSFIGCSHLSSVNPKEYYLDYGQYSSYYFVERGWDALQGKDYDLALELVDECVALYTEQAKELNDKCANQDSLEDIGICDSLNDVGQCVYIKASVNFELKDFDKVRSACREIDEYYFNSFVFGLSDWPWKPSEACQDLIEKLNREN